VDLNLQVYTTISCVPAEETLLIGILPFQLLRRMLGKEFMTAN
jgi:hypothetical protein